MGETDLIRNDLAQSAGAMRSQPLLVGITLGLGLAPLLLPGLLGILLLPLLLFQAGFVGMQRVWFLRAYRGKPLLNSEIWPLTRSFVGRMMVLGLVNGIVVGVVAFPIAFVTVLRAFERGDPMTAMPSSFFLTMAIAVLVVDVALTFVVPALSFTTRSVREAFRIGFRMIGETWPRSAWYVLTPGILASTLGFAVPRTVLGFGALLVLAIVGALLGLWFKGAIAAYYLRLRPETPDDGAAYVFQAPTGT